MALQAYLDATNRLLQNPVPATNPLFTDAVLTSFINEGRQQLAGDAQCIRANALSSTANGTQTYPFSTFSNFPAGTASGTLTWIVNPSPGETITLNGVVWTFVAAGAVGNQTNIGGTLSFTIATLANDLNNSVVGNLLVASYTQTSNTVLTITYKTVGITGNSYTLAASVATPSGATLTGGTLAGIQGVLTLRQMWVTTSGVQRLLTSRPWPWFNRYFVANGKTNANAVPTTWSQQGLATKGTFSLAPTPNAILTITADAVLIPSILSTDSDPEAIPYPFSDAVQYYAAHKAYLSLQRRDDAAKMFEKYMEFVQRAVQEATPTVFPMNYQGGTGAQIAASKQSVTVRPQAKGQ